MDLGLKDRVAIVTGGNRGIGYAISAELLTEGAHVVVANLDPARNAQAVEKLKAQSNGRVIGVPTDLNDAAAVEASVQDRRSPSSAASTSWSTTPPTSRKAASSP